MSENLRKTRLQEPRMRCSLRVPAVSKRPLTNSTLRKKRNPNKSLKMNRKYQGLIVLNTTGSEESVDDLVNAVAKEMEEEGAKLDEVKQVGRRKFAYNARHLDGGHYVNYYFEAEVDALGSIQDRLKLNNTVYLQHYQRLS